MSTNDVTRQLMRYLGCGERTAASLEQTILQAGVPDISDVQCVENENYRILNITDSNSQSYYVFISTGYFIEEIRRESLSGERIYFAIQ